MIVEHEPESKIPATADKLCGEQPQRSNEQIARESANQLEAAFHCGPRDVKRFTTIIHAAIEKATEQLADACIAATRCYDCEASVAKAVNRYGKPPAQPPRSEIHECAEAIVAELEQAGYLDFDGGEQHERAAIASGIDARINAAISGAASGTAAVATSEAQERDIKLLAIDCCQIVHGSSTNAEAADAIYERITAAITAEWAQVKEGE